MIKFRNVDDALKYIETPELKDETKWQALAFVLRELFEAQGFDTEITVGEE